MKFHFLVDDHWTVTSPHSCLSPITRTMGRWLCDRNGKRGFIVCAWYSPVSFIAPVIIFVIRSSMKSMGIAIKISCCFIATKNSYRYTNLYPPFSLFKCTLIIARIILRQIDQFCRWSWYEMVWEKVINDGWWKISNLRNKDYLW